MSTTSNPTPPVAAPPRLDPILVFSALGNPLRWRIVKQLADGKCHCVADLSKAMGMKSNGIGKHLGILRDAGILILVADEKSDGRMYWHHLPAVFRATPGVLDFGCCVVRL
ncbi:MAG: helix-turn-helix domain-containing protein [Verrucomicrobiota bacterium]